MRPSLLIPPPSYAARALAVLAAEKERLAAPERADREDAYRYVERLKLWVYRQAAQL